MVEGGDGIFYLTEKIYVHPNYKSRLQVNDIALIKLKRDVKRNKSVQIVCLPKTGEGDLAKMKTYGMATCWEAIKSDDYGDIPPSYDRHSNRLQYSVYPIQSNRLCSNMSALPFNSTVSFCAEVRKAVNRS